MRERPTVVVLCDDRQPLPQIRPAHDVAEVLYVAAAELPATLGRADVLLLWDFFSTALEVAWAEARKLAWVHVPAAGVDNVLFPSLVSSDVVVTNARGIFDRSIAEYVLGAIMACAKDAATSARLQREARWVHRETALVHGANALIVGTGPIGRETARLLRAIGMRVRGVGRVFRDGDPDFGTVYASSDIASHVGWADHVVLAAPLTPQTRGLVGRQVLTQMKEGSHLINVGRGALLDEAALVQALDHGPLWFATLDVFSVEPLPAASPLWRHPAVAVTPHMSGDVRGWQKALAEQFLANLCRWVAGEPLVNVVDKALGYPSTA